MTAALATEVQVTLRAGSVFTEAHPRFAGSGPFRILTSRMLPGTFDGPLVMRTLIDSVAAPGTPHWVGDDDFDVIIT
ncbi:hypothetical protein [Curtobacterium sp. MCSS17_016]|uniref:hypothetical protein n=1 Tax=Curtobacterium sp. MCSS17_016 TaxID=2175644 RepID=UPI000DA890BC|nr:hypothetical protein [Curtobacterium sp. MCSS17_016]WIE81101.1 hypothetical protein DEJ19_021740 [Curtobacterium sp. MCSS17_016]